MSNTVRHPNWAEKVAIYGGGNTAMDAARTVQRLGGSEAMIIYRRDREHMPAHEFEADEALQEGVKINWLRTIKEIDSTTFRVEGDESGRRVDRSLRENMKPWKRMISFLHLVRIPTLDFSGQSLV